MDTLKKYSWIPIFFGIAACSWMPHWSCHYYKIETGSSFIVGNFEFNLFHSLIAMLIYSALIIFNLIAISYIPIRFIAALLTGILHLTLGFIHISRLLNPFHFEVFGYTWSTGSSIREILFVFPFGIACIAISIIVNRLSTLKKDSAS